MARTRRAQDTALNTPANLLNEVRGLCRPLRAPADLDPLLERIGDARCVLLGEATHGTHEFYTWRAELSRRLILEKGFSFIAVEGDWPDAYDVNRFAKGYPGAATSARAVLRAFSRWPTWMWANEEVVELASWLHAHNRALPEDRKVGFYGLDVYSLWDSLHQVMGYLERSAPEALPAAKKALACFEPYAEDAQQYARATLLVPKPCAREAIDLLGAVRRAAPTFNEDSRDGHFVAEQNALVVHNAESYYRAMVKSDAESWNVRDRHMAETLDRLLAHHGPKSKAIVWEHNTHIGDARFTDMTDVGEVNLGELARERYGEQNVVLVGFGTHRGSVIASRAWDGPIEVMNVPPGRTGSWEDVLHEASGEDALLIFDPKQASEDMLLRRGHRAIGVVYRPEFERYGNYVPTVLPQRYDAFLFIEQTRALSPLHLRAQMPEEAPETYPTGM